jgi:hypothetical protein
VADLKRSAKSMRALSRHLVRLALLPATAFLETSCTATRDPKGDVALAPFYVVTPKSFEKAVIDGLKEAKRDFRAGKSKFIVCGHSSAETEKVAAFLRDTYSITPEFRDSVVSEAEVEGARIYNEMARLLFQTEKNVDLARETQEVVKRNQPNQSLQPTAPSRRG